MSDGHAGQTCCLSQVVSASPGAPQHARPPCLQSNRPQCCASLLHWLAMHAVHCLRPAQVNNHKHSMMINDECYKPARLPYDGASCCALKQTFRSCLQSNWPHGCPSASNSTPANGAQYLSPAQCTANNVRLKCLRRDIQQAICNAHHTTLLVLFSDCAYRAICHRAAHNHYIGLLCVEPASMHLPK